MRQAAALGRILGTIAALQDFKDLNLPYNWVTLEKALLENFKVYNSLKEQK